MKDEEIEINTRDYERIEKAIGYIQQNFQQQPSLKEIAEYVELSPFYFQKLFKTWAGISPKQFLQYTSINYAKKALKEPDASLLDTAYETGLSGTSRLHDLFIKIEAMTPGEFKEQGAGLTIHYQYIDSRFGLMLVASTSKGICYMGFVTDEGKKAFADLYDRFPKATFIENSKDIHQQAVDIFSVDEIQPQKLNLHVNGTAFQIKVWEALLKIPAGHLQSYTAIAENLEQPNASRAVGTAIGGNPIAYLIPCHRVIRSTGELGGYMWGLDKKATLIGWEAAQMNQTNDQ